MDELIEQVSDVINVLDTLGDGEKWRLSQPPHHVDVQWLVTNLKDLRNWAESEGE